MASHALSVLVVIEALKLVPVFEAVVWLSGCVPEQPVYESPYATERLPALWDTETVFVPVSGFTRYQPSTTFEPSLTSPSRVIASPL